MTAPPKVGLREQADCAQRELAMRHRVYPGLVSRGRMTAAESAREIDLMRAIRDTLRMIAEHEDVVRDCLAEQIIRRRHPAVAAIMSRWPDARMTATMTVTKKEMP